MQYSNGQEDAGDEHTPAHTIARAHKRTHARMTHTHTHTHTDTHQVGLTYRTNSFEGRKLGASLIANSISKIIQSHFMDKDQVK